MAWEVRSRSAGPGPDKVRCDWCGRMSESRHDFEQRAPDSWTRTGVFDRCPRCTSWHREDPDLQGFPGPFNAR